jgi:putative proteasome-type protease
MTYCVGMKLESGLIAIADTRITSGNETTSAKKIFLNVGDDHALFLMTSGLRSVRDKALTYFKELLLEEGNHFDKLYKAVNAFGEQLRKVAIEDRESLELSGLHFNLHTIVGGQLKGDSEPKMFLLYPEGNWIEIGPGTPFVIIGNSGYGKPILNRIVKYNTSISKALIAGFLSFDSTRVSANDVGFPIDIVIYKNDSFELVEKRYHEEDLKHVSNEWNESLSAALEKMPEEWMEEIITESDKCLPKFIH